MLLVCVLLITSVGFAADSNDASVSDDAHLRELETISSAISDADIDLSQISINRDPGTFEVDWYYNCINPSCNGALCVTVCYADAHLYAQNSHFSIIPWGTCNVSYFSSRAEIVCPVCYAEYGTLDSHDCWEIHDFCNKGWYDICPCDVS